VSDFEFISIVLSIVVGLGITRILGGLASVVEQRAYLQANWLTLGWAVGVLLWQVVFWLGTVNSTRGLPNWTVVEFGVLLLLAIGLYFASALVLPGHIDSETDLSAHFDAMRRPFFLVYAAWALVSSFIGGLENLVALGPAAWFGQATGVGVGILGMAATGRRLHVTILAVHLLGLLGVTAARFYTV
jgi:hypothetical protein